MLTNHGNAEIEMMALRDYSIKRYKIEQSNKLARCAIFKTNLSKLIFCVHLNGHQVRSMIPVHQFAVS